MRPRPATRAAAGALAFALGALAGPLALERAVAAAPITVGLIGSRNDHLVEEIARELVTARLSVALVEASGDAAAAEDLTGAPADLIYGVVVAPDDRRVVVFARRASAGGVPTRIEMQVDPRDRLARRRTCIAVVEYLRVLAEGARQPSVAPVESVASAPAPLPVEAAASGSPRPAPAPVPVEAAASGSPRPAPAPAPVLVVVTPPRTDDRGRPLPAERWWSMGVATTLDLSGAQGGATSHVQFLWRAPAGAHFALRARGLWPLLGVGTDIRMWTFGVAADLQVSFVDQRALVRPFVGLSIGGRLIVTDAGGQARSESRTAFTPSGTLGLQAGLGYRVVTAVEIFVEIEAARDWLVPGVDRGGYEAAIANAVSLHSSVGALFNY